MFFTGHKWVFRDSGLIGLIGGDLNDHVAGLCLNCNKVFIAKRLSDDKIRPPLPKQG